MVGKAGKWRIHKTHASDVSVEVSERDGVRSLHLGSETVQSAMRLKAPDALELAYTRAMMAFLLFYPMPREILMVGLGGGSLAKFIYHQLPKTHAKAIEINPQVVAAARHYFYLPPDDERFQVELAEGGAYVAERAASADIIMVDGYGSHAQAGSLSSDAFYAAAARALTPDGMLVVNLWASDPQFHQYLQRIDTAFNGLVLCLPAEQRSNVVVLAFQKSPGSPRWDELRERAKSLEQMYGLEFPLFVAALRKMNLHTDKRLLV